LLCAIVSMRKRVFEGGGGWKIAPWPIVGGVRFGKDEEAVGWKVKGKPAL
jgi:hypothetical protein